MRTRFGGLEEGMKLVPPKSDYRRRIDLLRMYLHYLALRYRLELAERNADRVGIVAAIRDETIFGGRLADTHMIHSRPLLGKAFPRRFREYEELLAGINDAESRLKEWRQVGTPPERTELDRLWAADKKLLGLR